MYRKHLFSLLPTGSIIWHFNSNTELLRKKQDFDSESSSHSQGRKLLQKRKEKCHNSLWAASSWKGGSKPGLFTFIPSDGCLMWAKRHGSRQKNMPPTVSDNVLWNYTLFKRGLFNKGTSEYFACQRKHWVKCAFCMQYFLNKNFQGHVVTSGSIIDSWNKQKLYILFMSNASALW